MQLDFRLLLAFASISQAYRDFKQASGIDVVRKDVAIIGGGASGTYAAFRLREDHNASVVVVELSGRLGGHVNTYHDPVTNASIDYGVQTYTKNGVAEAFFASLGIKIGPARSAAPSIQSYVNSADGTLLTNYEPPTEAIAALQRYLVQAKKYEKYLAPGLWNFPAPKDIPDDLLLPFEEFAKKYDLEAAVPTIQEVANPGVGGFQGILTIHVMAFAFGAPVTDALLNNGFFNAANASNEIVYEKAYEVLKNDIMFKTSVQSATRTPNGVKLVVSNADGIKTIIEAKQLLIALPPSLSNLKPFELDPKEHEVFSTWTPTASFVGMLRTTAIARNHTVNFISKAAVPNHYMDLWDEPYAITFNPKGETDEDLWQVLIASNKTITIDEAKAQVLDALNQLTSAGTFKTDKQPQTEIVAFADHSSILHREPAERYRNGYVQDFLSVQGHRSTWYTGTLWTEDFSSSVWAFTDTVLERMMKKKMR